MKTSSLFFAFSMASLLLMTSSACSVNDGDSSTDGDSEKAETENDSELEGDLPDGDCECECNCPDGDQAADGDAESAEIESEAEVEIEAETADDFEEEIEAEIEDVPLCGSGLTLACGDSLAHNTDVEGRVNEWSGYNCSARAENGREAVYTFSTEKDCSVTLRLTNLTKDIDLFLLADCDAFSCMHMSSTPLDIQDDETVEFEAAAGVNYFVSVDGYAGATGSYTIEADCNCAADGDE